MEGRREDGVVEEEQVPLPRAPHLEPVVVVQYLVYVYIYIYI